MPGSESFEEFYSRTVWNVTHLMHELANHDGEADHAIREAYAQAYQQWHEVSAQPDPQGWLLQTAEQAYRRRLTGLRRVSGGLAGGSVQIGGSATDTSPDPGPATGTSMSPARTAGSAARRALAAGSAAGRARAAGARRALASVAASGRQLAASNRLLARLSQPGTADQERTRKALLLTMVAAVLVAAVGAGYIALGGSQPAGTAGRREAGPADPGDRHGPRMLTAGRTGPRSAVPWSLVGAGWTLAEFSTAEPAATGSGAAAGRSHLYLVDPQGGKYQMRTWPADVSVTLLDWSGNAATALLKDKSPAGGYSVLSLATGHLTNLRLPAGLTVTGFTRPEGLNLLAISHTQAGYQLRRYNLSGVLQARIATLRGRPHADAGDCPADCKAVSSPTGITAVWGVGGHQMQLDSNAGGLVRELPVRGSGTADSCLPVRWWNSATVLASCAPAGRPDSGSARLWLVPADGAAARPLAQGPDRGAWQVGRQVYVTRQTSTGCRAAAGSGAGLTVLRVGPGDVASIVFIPHGTQKQDGIVASVGRRLLLLDRQGCPASSSLLWFNPARGTEQTLLTAKPDQMGVLAAVAYGSGQAVTW